ncbi:lymphocyte antigen 75-like [Patiria miniata]|uniref:Macrophage mannose receptor 1-like n=1 Tax=Patiria miniata TaxID=46514 RepID=A0A914A4Y9_PATMI|nr:lymphocyte antigen 75-like [Patiria miniata]
MQLQILVIGALLAIATAATPPIPQCGGSWQQLSGTDQCFMVVTSPKKWTAARTDCQKNKRGDLAIIPDATTSTFIKNVLSGATGQYWIGLHDVIAENTFKWVDDTPLGSWNNWNPGEPNNVGNEDCAAVYASSAKWNDDGCSKAKPYICSKLSTVLAVCDESNGWRSYDGKCYRFASGAAKWKDAETQCGFFQGGHIAYIKKTDDQTFLDNLQVTHSSSYWIGLQDKANGNDGDYQWSDGSTFDTTVNKWGNNQPKNQWYGQDGDCGYVSTSGTWAIDKCTAKYKYVCEIPEGTCPVGWSAHAGFCYQLNAVANNLMTWTDAKDFCTTQGAFLTPILGDSEYVFVKSFLNGLDSNGIQDLFFGLSDINVDGTFKWAMDNSKLGSYKNWAPGQPGAKNGQKDCAYIKTGVCTDAQGLWYYGDCFKLAAFICRITKGVPLTYNPPGPINAYCDNTDYDLYNNLCYKIIPDSKSWADAETACENENAQLVKVEDDGVQSFMSSRLNVIKKRVWIGLTDNAIAGTYKWTDGTTLGSYNNWAPNNPITSLHCVTLTGAPLNYGLWKTRKCTQKNYYACQKKSQSGVGPTSKPNPTAGYYDRCGNGWEYDKDSNKCFLFRPTAYENWFNARIICRQEGGDLLSIQGSDDMNYANGRVKSFGSGFTWIGCNDLGVEGGWGWSDGKPFAKINWAPGQPNNIDTYYSGGQHCCEIWNNYGDWNDDDCYYSHSYACSRDEYVFKYFITYTEKKMDETVDLQLDDMWPRECAERCVQETSFTCLSFDYDRQGRTCFLRKVAKTAGGLLPTYDTQHFDHYERDQNVQPPLPPTPSSLNCPTGWGRYLDNCYYANYDKKEFVAAEAACPNGAMLASVADVNVNHFLQAYVWEQNSIKNVGDTRFWIGLHDRDMENEFKWTNGETVTFTSWNAYEPNDVNGEDCIEMYIDNGLWNDLPCKGYNYGSLCKQGLTSGNPAPPVDGNCPNGWLPWIDRCYLLSTTKATWDDAGTNCKKTSGAQLVVIEDKMEMAFLSGQLGQQTGGVYIGEEFFIALSDSKTAGLYEWMDKTPITYTHWAAGQPDDRTGHCVTVTSGRNAGFWVDRDCTTKYRYICEKAKANKPPIQPPVINPGTTPSSSGCVTGWIGYGSRCFKAVEFANAADRVDWDEANRVCTNFGGALASIHHPDEEQYLVDNLQLTTNQRFWIGLNDQRMEGGYRWSDGTAVQYTSWNGGEPNDYSGSEECVETDLKGGKWNDLFCWYPRNFLCSIPKGQAVITTPKPTPPQGGDCYPGDSTWSHLAPYCYKVYNYWYDWHGANQMCHNDDAHLVSIHSDDEQTFIKNRMTYSNNYWIGLKSNLTHPGDHLWEDGSPYDYINWQSQPDPGNGDKLCTVMIGEDSGNKAKWESHNCGESGPFVCKKRLDSVPVTHYPTSPSTGGCQPGWKQYNDNFCYKFMGLGGQQDPKLNWIDAKKACSDMTGAHFASVNDLDVHNALTADMITLDGDVWIGMSNIGNHGSYLWTDSSSRGLYVWAYNQPVYDFNATSSCVCMKYEDEESGKWFSEDCQLLHSYLCKMPADESITTTQAPPTPCQTANDNLKDYIQYGTACFKVDLSKKRTFEEAKQYCENDGATLASVLNGFEQAKLVTMTSDADDMTWIGLYDDPDTRLFTWLDGWPFFIEYWGWSSPNGNNCTAINMNNMYSWYNGVWENVACEDMYYTACKYSTETPPTPPPTQAGYCESGWSDSGTSCYIMGTGLYETATFKEAVYDCDRYYDGAHVATISSKAENQFVMNLAQKQFSLSWILIGLERGKDGGWEWIDNSPLAYQNWVDDAWDHESANCAEIRTYAQGKWDTIGCDVQSHYVCEKAKTLITNTEAPFLPKDCATQYVTSGWKALRQYCYLFVPSSLSWDQAEADCNTKGGYLASVLDEDEQNFIKNLAGQDYYALHSWLGLRKDLATGDYKWTDGSSTVYKVWDTDGEPDDRDDMSTCAQMWHDGPWITHDCGKSISYTCKRRYDNQKPVTKPPQPPPTGNCPKDWFKVENGCYQIRNNQSMWNVSRADCRKEEGGDLAAIHSALTQTFITSMMKGGADDLWIGYRTLDAKEGWGYHWVDQSDIWYINWAKQRPNVYWEPGYCVTLTIDNELPGRWVDVSCSEKHGYVCYKPLDPTLPTAAPPENNCPKDDYLPYVEDCFKINMDKMNFADATKYCADDGTYLATITNGYDEAFVMYNTLMQGQAGAPPDAVWIGLRADNDTREYKWVDGWPVIYTNWDVFQPMEENGLCVQLTQDTYWQTAPCTNDTKAPFICRTTTGTVVIPTDPAHSGTCPDDWVAFHDHCYQFNTDTEGYESWYKASHKCEQDHNGRLLSIHTKAENDFIRKKFSELYPDSYYWDGLWLDLSRNATGTGHTSFYWNDGHALDYSNWDKGEPQQNEWNDCAAVLPKAYGKWQAQSCEYGNYYVCYMEQDVVAPPKPYSGGLGGGAIAGIVIGVLVVLLLALGAGYFLMKNRHAKPLDDPGLPPTTGFDNVLYTPSLDEVKTKDIDTKPESMSDA